MGDTEIRVKCLELAVEMHKDAPDRLNAVISAAERMYRFMRPHLAEAKAA